MLAHFRPPSTNHHNIINAISGIASVHGESRKSGQSTRLSLDLISLSDLEIIYGLHSAAPNLRDRILALISADLRYCTYWTHTDPKPLIAYSIWAHSWVLFTMQAVAVAVGWDSFQLTRERYLIAIDPADINNCINWVPQNVINSRSHHDEDRSDRRLVDRRVA